MMNNEKLLLNSLCTKAAYIKKLRDEITQIKSESIGPLVIATEHEDKIPLMKLYENITHLFYNNINPLLAKEIEILINKHGGYDAIQKKFESVEENDLNQITLLSRIIDDEITAFRQIVKELKELPNKKIVKNLNSMLITMSSESNAILFKKELSAVAKNEFAQIPQDRSGKLRWMLTKDTEDKIKNSPSLLQKIEAHYFLDFPGSLAIIREKLIDLHNVSCIIENIEYIKSAIIHPKNELSDYGLSY